MTKPKLSKTQIEMLAKVAALPPSETLWTGQGQQWRTAKALRLAGLVTGQSRVAITEAGREALKLATFRI